MPNRNIEKKMAKAQLKLKKKIENQEREIKVGAPEPLKVNNYFTRKSTVGNSTTTVSEVAKLNNVVTVAKPINVQDDTKIVLPAITPIVNAREAELGSISEEPELFVPEVMLAKKNKSKTK